MLRAGRREPYTDRGVTRLACVRCQSPARFQWNACADGNLWRPICGPCDVELNRLVLSFMRDPEAHEKVELYAIRKGVPT